MKSKTILNISKPLKTSDIYKVKIKLLKQTLQNGLNLFMTSSNRTWTTNEIPGEWKISVQIPIPKIVRPKNIKDYRRILPCSSGYKVYTKWISKNFNIHPRITRLPIHLYPEKTVL
jgi:hypothetical protein